MRDVILLFGLFFGLLFASSHFSYSQIRQSARLQGQSGAGVADKDLSHILFNPSGIEVGPDRQFNFGIAYRPNLLHESVHENAVWVASRFKDWMHVGVAFSQLRFDRIYRDQIWAVSMSREFGPYWSLGLSVERRTEKILLDDHEYSEWDFRVGTRIQLNSKIQVGLVLDDLAPNSFTSNLAPTGTIGWSYQLLSSLRWIFDCTLSSHEAAQNRLQWKTGFSYAVFPDTLWLRTGWMNKPVGQFFGLRYRWDSFDFDLALGLRGKLGLVPQIDWIYGL